MSVEFGALWKKDVLGAAAEKDLMCRGFSNLGFLLGVFLCAVLCIGSPKKGRRIWVGLLSRAATNGHVRV